MEWVAWFVAADIYVPELRWKRYEFARITIEEPCTLWLKYFMLDASAAAVRDIGPILKSIDRHYRKR